MTIEKRDRIVNLINNCKFCDDELDFLYNFVVDIIAADYYKCCKLFDDYLKEINSDTTIECKYNIESELFL